MKADDIWIWDNKYNTDEWLVVSIVAVSPEEVSYKIIRETLPSLYKPYMWIRRDIDEFTSNYRPATPLEAAIYEE